MKQQAGNINYADTKLLSTVVNASRSDRQALKEVYISVCIRKGDEDCSFGIDLDLDHDHLLKQLAEYMSPADIADAEVMAKERLESNYKDC